MKGPYMPLEQLYYVSQITAVILILGSLIAIFFQQRQSNKIARSDMTQRAMAEYSSVLREVMADPNLAEIFRKVMYERTELTPVETTQICTYFNLTIAVVSTSYRLIKDDMIERSYLQDSENNVIWYLTAPVFAGEWRRVQRLDLFRPDFINHINSRFEDLYPDHDAATLNAGSDPKA